jgi:hypothetical protein
MNAHRIRALVVDEALEPLGSIGHRSHRRCLFQPSSMRFQQGRSLKSWHVPQS